MRRLEFVRGLLDDLNEVLSIRAQEYHPTRTIAGRQYHLNEVLSIRAQESMPLINQSIDHNLTSMKS